MANQAELIEREVQRRIAQKTQQANEQIAELRSIIADQNSKLLEQYHALRRVEEKPLTFGTLIKVHNYPDPTFFQDGDEVLVIDGESSFAQQTGTLVSNDNLIIDDEGYAFVRLQDGHVERFSVGLEGKDAAQIRLATKDDGTYAVVSEGDSQWEVRGIPELDLKAGEPVKILPDTKAIIERGYDFCAGPVCKVSAITEHGVEIQHKGEIHLVLNPHDITLEEGDRVACDSGMFCVISKLSPDPRKKYKLTSELTTTWDDIGGLEKAKKQLRDAIESPLKYPDHFAHYKAKPFKGAVLHGPPGCGKTLLVRVCAWAIAQMHGKEANESAYIYVKGPEVLDKWVGNTEGEIRALFDRGRRHFWEHGYKSSLVFDEADALFPMRGSRRSSDIADTIVPMVLGEMDGVDPKQTEANPVVWLLTNRVDILDPAMTRPGRISRHIKIDRPDQIVSMSIMDIHSKDVPFAENKDAILAVACSDLFSKGRIIYRVNNEHEFTMGDCVSGAMLENIVEIAKMQALNRDIKNNTMTGVTMEDFREAIKENYLEQKGLNHSYDLQDFAEKKNLDPQNVSVERCFGSA